MSSVKITYIQYYLPEEVPNELPASNDLTAKIARRDQLVHTIRQLSGFLVQRSPEVLNNLHSMQEELATLNAEIAQRAGTT